MGRPTPALPKQGGGNDNVNDNDNDNGDDNKDDNDNR